MSAYKVTALVSILLAAMLLSSVSSYRNQGYQIRSTHYVTSPQQLPSRVLLQLMPTRIAASKALTTVVTYRTTIPTCSFTTSCAMTRGAVTACRRLRQDIDIDALLPSKPTSLEVTVAPVEDAIHSFIPDILSSNEPRDVLVNGLMPGGGCGKMGDPFGVTIIYTRTVTSDVTCLASVTHTNTFTLAGCTPAGLVYCTE